MYLHEFGNCLILYSLPFERITIPLVLSIDRLMPRVFHGDAGHHHPRRCRFSDQNQEGHSSPAFLKQWQVRKHCVQPL